MTKGPPSVRIGHTPFQKKPTDKNSRQPDNMYRDDEGNARSRVCFGKTCSKHLRNTAMSLLVKVGRMYNHKVYYDNVQGEPDTPVTTSLKLLLIKFCFSFLALFLLIWYARLDLNQ